jgi:hypothetical protein
MCIKVTCGCSSGLICDLWFNISAAHELRPDSSAGEEVDSVALGKLIEVMVVIDDQHLYNLLSCCLRQYGSWFTFPFRLFQKKAKAVI